MPNIHLTTFIEAPIERVFDLCRNINLHSTSMKQTKEVAIAGVITGLINKGETVTWQARHLGKKRILQSKITAMEPSNFFCDEMVKGDFKSMRHEHHFKQIANGTIMIDKFEFETPYGVLGKFINSVFLSRYMKNLLQKRNLVIKDYAETNKWRLLL